MKRELIKISGSSAGAGARTVPRSARKLSATTSATARCLGSRSGNSDTLTGFHSLRRSSEGMTKNNQRDHEEIIWSEAIPDLNISEITG
jgi:hypothetical protein